MVTRHLPLATCHSPLAARHSRPRGFTMPELLVTISIMAFLLLVGVGTYWRMNRGFALRAGVSSVDAAMRGARAFAVHERSPAVVVLEPTPQNPDDPIQRLYALGKRTVGCWHFELEQIEGTKLKGALGQVGEVAGAAASAPGKIGRSLTFDGSSTAISVRSPYFDEIRDGVFIEAYVWPDSTGLLATAVLPIVSKCGEWGKPAFVLGLAYSPRGGQDLFDLRGGVATESGTYSAYTEALIRAGEWTHVALAYIHDARDEDGNPLGVILRINGQEVKPLNETTGTGKLEPNTLALLIGRDGDSYFKGRLDEVKIGALVSGEVFKLPENTEVRADPGSSDGRVHFDDEGKLDTRYHGRTARFRVVSRRDGLRRTVQVNWLGGVEVRVDEREVE